MTQQVKMPEPEVLYTTTNRDGDPLRVRGYTSAQMEAYAAAKVREALECVSREVHNVLHPANPREDWTQYAYIREEAAHDAESAIRALIPQHDNE